MKILPAILLLSFLVFPALAFDASISGWSTAGSSHLSLVSETQTSTNLMKFGPMTTNGSYLVNAASTKLTSNGITGYQFAAMSGATVSNSSLVAETYGSMIAYDVASLHQDQTNVPDTLCDTGDLGISNYNSSNSSSVVISGKYPQTQNAVITVGMMGSGDGAKNTAKYSSEVDVEDVNMSVTHESSGLAGLNAEWMSGSVIAGHNKNYKTAQFEKDVNYHAIQSANESTGFKAGSIIKFEGHAYSGPDMPIGWEVCNTTNSTSNQTVNQTVNQTINLTEGN